MTDISDSESLHVEPPARTSVAEIPNNGRVSAATVGFLAEAPPRPDSRRWLDVKLILNDSLFSSDVMGQVSMLALSS